MSTPTTKPFPFPPIHSFPPFFTRQVNDRTWHSQLVNWNAVILAYCRYHHIFTLTATSGAITTNSGGLDIDGNTTGAGKAIENNLFSNETINRSLKPETILSIFEFMVQTGSANWLDSPENDEANRKKNRKKKQISGDDSDDAEEDGYEQQYARYEAFQKKQQQQQASGSSKSSAALNSVVVYWRRPQEWATLISDWVDSTGQNGSVLTLYELVESDAVRKQEFRELHPAILKLAVDVLVARNKAVIMRDANGLVVGIKVI